MTTMNEARDIILKEFNTEWVLASTIPLSKVAYDNSEFSPPDDDTAWIRIMIIPNFGTQTTLGAVNNRTFRKFGQLTIFVYTAVGDATFNSDTHAQDALTIFEGKALSGLWFRDAHIVQDGIIESKGKWWQQRMIADFQFDEIK